jgi:hypothetical protein
VSIYLLPEEEPPDEDPPDEDPPDDDPEELLDPELEDPLPLNDDEDLLLPEEELLNEPDEYDPLSTLLLDGTE